MTLRVVGAGLPRTGTTSLKAAIEQLTGERCYHMFELIANEPHRAPWWRAVNGDIGALASVLDGYGSAVDWPAALFWRELMAQNADALIVLSHRGDADTWWRSVDRTVWAAMRRAQGDPAFAAFNAKMRELVGLGADWDDESTAKQLYTRVIADVHETVPPERLLVWQPGDGWEPLCEALNVPVPDDVFPQLNDRASFRAQAGFDETDSV